MNGPMPELNSLVDLTHDGVEYLSRVSDISGSTVAVAAPLNGTLEPPEPGSAMSLRWTAGERGRYVASTRLVSMRRDNGLRSWNLQFDGPAVVDQRRKFVRAGGGETVRVANRWSGSQTGEVADIGEGGVRCRFPYADLRVGEPVEVTVRLGSDLLTVQGWVLRAVDDVAARVMDVAVTFNLDEHDAGVVRRYVLHKQVLARRAAAEAGR
jgi:PilZ domain